MAEVEHIHIGVAFEPDNLEVDTLMVGNSKAMSVGLDMVMIVAGGF